MKTSINPSIRGIDRESIRKAIIRQNFQLTSGQAGQDLASGRKLAERLGYHPEILARLSDESTRYFSGVGNPFKTASFNEGCTVLDLGCGTGLDCLTGWVLANGECEIFGMDMSASLLERARANAAELKASDIRFIRGYAEEIPFPSGSVDTVISNGVFSLCTDKNQVYHEIYRVLRPGGNFIISDVMLEHPVSTANPDFLALWFDGIAGALPSKQYLSMISKTGFIGLDIVHSFDLFETGSLASVAKTTGARSYTLRGMKPNQRMEKILSGKKLKRAE